MAVYDFQVDIETLISAANEASEVVQRKRDEDVEDYVPGEEVLAHDVVWEAVNEFQDRWERGINDMIDDIEEVGRRLGKVASNYVEFDETARSALERLAGIMAALPASRLIEGDNGR